MKHSPAKKKKKLQNVMNVMKHLHITKPYQIGTCTSVFHLLEFVYSCLWQIRLMPLFRIKSKRFFGFESYFKHEVQDKSSATIAQSKSGFKKKKKLLTVTKKKKFLSCLKTKMTDIANHLQRIQHIRWNGNRVRYSQLFVEET